MGSDGYQAQWVPGKERAEKVQAEAITIDGRKEWTCKFCSQTNVWTRWLQGKHKKANQETQGEPTRGSRLEEDCKREVEQETDSKRTLDEQKKSLQRQLRDIEKFTDMDPVFRDRQKERWKEELQEIERKRTELLPEHQKMQKWSQKLQSLQDKHRDHLKRLRL